MLRYDPHHIIYPKPFYEKKLPENSWNKGDT